MVGILCIDVDATSLLKSCRYGFYSILSHFCWPSKKGESSHLALFFTHDLDNHGNECVEALGVGRLFN